MEREKVPAERRGCVERRFPRRGGAVRLDACVPPRGAGGRVCVGLQACSAESAPQQPHPGRSGRGAPACGQVGQADLGRYRVRSWEHRESRLLGEQHVCASLFSPCPPRPSCSRPLLSCPWGRPHPARSLLWAQPVLLAASLLLRPLRASLLLCSGRWSRPHSLPAASSVQPSSAALRPLSVCPLAPVALAHTGGFRAPGAALCGRVRCRVG